MDCGENKRIYLSSPTMHDAELRFIHEAFEANWVAPLGANVDGFERDLADYVGIGYALALSSGTAALHLAVKLADVKPGDVVLCSDLTFAATVNPVSYEGGVQVFIDAERETWNMDPRALEMAFRKYGARVKAVIVVNLYGTPAKLDEICQLCDAYGAVLIEDAAESLGATYKGQQTGSFGQYSALSFNGNKIITTSGGGALLSNNEHGIKKARYWATQSRDPVPHYEHREIGYNYRLSNISAGIGRGQMLHLTEHIQAKKRLFDGYMKGLADLPTTMNPYLSCSSPNFWLSCMMIERECSVSPEALRIALEANNMEARPIWKPMHLQPVFSRNDFISAEGDVGADVFRRGLCLPSDVKMSDEEQRGVIELIARCFGKG